MTESDTLYRDYHIHRAGWSPSPAFDWEYVHKDYDPTPMYADDGPSDHRIGRCASEQECRDEIDMALDD